MRRPKTETRCLDLGMWTSMLGSAFTSHLLDGSPIYTTCLIHVCLMAWRHQRPCPGPVNLFPFMNPNAKFPNLVHEKLCSTSLCSFL